MLPLMPVERGKSPEGGLHQRAVGAPQRPVRTSAMVQPWRPAPAAGLAVLRHVSDAPRARRDIDVLQGIEDLPIFGADVG